MNMIADFGLAMLDEEIQNAMAGSMAWTCKCWASSRSSLGPWRSSFRGPLDNDMVKTASDIDPRQWVSPEFRGGRGRTCRTATWSGRCTRPA